MEDMIIRRETDRIILWSRKHKAYFCSTDNEKEIALKEALQGNIISKEFYEELSDLGFFGNRREILSTNPHGLSAPLEYYFDFTNNCNLACTHCYNRNNLNTFTMNAHQIKYIIQDMAKSGVMRLHLAGGEPTLYPKQLETYLNTAKSFGIVTSLSSNGTLINEHICRIIAESEAISVTVSIEAAEERKNALIRGAGVLGKALAGIDQLVEYKKKYNAPYVVAIKTSYDVETSAEDFEKMIQLAIKHKVDVIKFFNPERCIFHSPKHYSKTAKKYYENMMTVKLLAKKYENDIFVAQIVSPVLNCNEIGLPNMKGCISAQELITIQPSGQITPCLMNHYNLGNIFDYGSIQDCYASEAIREYLKKTQNYDCQDCQNHSQCRGGCQVRKIVEHGKIEKVDPLCPKKNNIPLKKSTHSTNGRFLQKIYVAHSL